MKNRENLLGFIALTLFTTLIWSLNKNFLILNASWLEVFGVVTIGVLIGTIFYTKK